jgi:hypothetical protein
MENYFFMRAVLGWLAQPRRFNRLLAFTLQALAALIVPFSLVTFFRAGKVIFDLPSSGILGGIFFQIFFVAGIYCVVHGLLIRARDIEALPGGDYNMFPLARILVRTAGETFAAFIGLVAVGGGIFVWFTGKSVSTILSPPSKFLGLFGDTTFMGGIEFMVGGVLSAVLTLVVATLVADGLHLLTEAAARLPEARQNSEPSFKLRSGTGN